jgi:hypothetical protein
MKNMRVNDNSVGTGLTMQEILDTTALAQLGRL